MELNNKATHAKMGAYLKMVVKNHFEKYSR